ncbi:MAG: hypothetical protein ACX94C_10480 [Phycisphaerales bacterium]
MKHVATFILCLLPFVSTPARANTADIGPFDAMTDIPADVDAAAVFYNPAETILLSPVGRSLRSLLAMGGIFTQTERAWGALADAFNDPVDETIRSLLSDQVAVVWDGLDGFGSDGPGVTGSFDARWTLICKVDPDYVARIRRSLRPVKRDIIHARPVYAIEQGRYHVALIDPKVKGASATVVLAPRSGAELLSAVLAHANAGRVPESGTITAGHEPMLAELSAYHDAMDDGTWSFVIMSRLDIFSKLLASPLPEQVEADQLHTLAAIVKLNQRDLRCSFATNLPVADDTPDAPVDLFDAVAPDSVFTIASARSPVLGVSGRSLRLDMTLSSAVPTPASDSVFDAPALFSLNPGESDEMCVTACFLHDQREPGATARMSDAAAHSLISALDPAQAPSFEGRFPEALRMIDLRIPRSIDTDPASWPGASSQLAWLNASTSDQDLVLASLAPMNADPASRIQRLAEAAQTLDALDAPARSGVLLRVSMNPAGTLRLFDNPDAVNFALARIIDEFDLGVRRGVETSMRGRLVVRFTESAAKPKLGNSVGGR